MHDKPLVSIIILCYNYGRFLPKAIDSALAQTFTDREVIVVDNGSADDTADAVRNYGSKVVSLRIEKNVGRSGGKNAGLKIAKGKYIQFLDADDTIYPEKLQKQAIILESDPAIDVVYSDSLFVNEQNLPMDKTSEWYRERHFQPEEGFLRRLAQENIFLTHDSLTRLDIIKKIGGFDESEDMLEDWDFSFRLALNGFHFHYLKETLATYYFHSTSLTKDPRRSYGLREHFVSKHLNDPITRRALGEELFRFFEIYQRRVLASNLYNLQEWAICRKQLRKALKANRFRVTLADLKLYVKSIVKGVVIKNN